MGTAWLSCSPPPGSLPLPHGALRPHTVGCHCLVPPEIPCFARFFTCWSLGQAWGAEGISLFSLHRTEGGWGGTRPFNLFLKEF